MSYAEDQSLKMALNAAIKYPSNLKQTWSKDKLPMLCRKISVSELLPLDIIFY